MQGKILQFSVLLSLFLFVVFTGNAQQQIENPGFEEWEEIGYGPDIMEPVNWSSLKTSDGGTTINNLAPVVWWKSTDAHSGQHSVKLKNTVMLAINISGVLTNGRVHSDFDPTESYIYTDVSDDQWNTTCNATPDSLVAWIKYLPQGDDMGTIMAVLHSGSAKIPDDQTENWIAIANFQVAQEYNDWTRISIPFIYMSSDMPEYILTVMYSGNGLQPEIGSELYIDDMELIYNPVCTDEISINNLKIYYSGNMLRIYPVSDFISGKGQLSIFDLSGQKLNSFKVDLEDKNEFSISLPSGIYMANLQTGDKNIVQKLFVR